MIIKRIPEDFIVEEIPESKQNENGNYSIYLLKKRNLDTFTCLNIIKKKFNLKSNFSAAGLKDKHGITSQYLSIYGNYGNKLNLKEKNFSLEFQFYSNKPIKIGNLKGNKFTIVIRDIKKEQIEKIKHRLNMIKELGIINYFDNQRFGSYSSKKGFIGKEILNKNYEKVLFIFLTYYIKSENKNIKDVKRFIEANWKDWNSCIQFLLKSKVKYRNFLKILEYLKRSNNDFKNAINLINKSLFKIYISAYQSYLWNSITYNFLKNIINKNNNLIIPYYCGNFIFLKNKDNNLSNLKQLRFSLSQVYDPSNKYKKRLVNTIKQIIDTENTNLEIKGMRKLPLRNLIIMPKNISINNPEIDEFNKNKYKMTILFNLPPGSYATLIVKYLQN